MLRKLFKGLFSVSYIYLVLGTVSPIELTAQINSKIVIEAESGEVTAPMTKGSDTAAGGGAYIMTPNGSNGLGKVTFNFTIESAGRYKIWARVHGPSVGNDSFIVSVDSNVKAEWHFPQKTRVNWGWARVHDRMTRVNTFSLQPGAHVLTFEAREDGAKLDKIVITDDRRYFPSGSEDDPGTLLIDDNSPNFSSTGQWSSITDINAIGGQYLSSSNKDSTATYNFTVPIPGIYDLNIHLIGDKAAATKVSYLITERNNSRKRNVNHRIARTQWRLIGRFEFRNQGRILITTPGDLSVSVDAIKLVLSAPLRVAVTKPIPPNPKPKPEIVVPQKPPTLIVGQGWRSKLFPLNWTPIDASILPNINLFEVPDGAPGKINEDGDRIGPGHAAYHPYQFLHDFGYAGYHNGMQELPPVSEPSCLNRGRVFNVVKDFGCKPNPGPSRGGADSKECIQNAIRAAKRAGGGVVYLPPGEYRVTTGDNQDSLNIRGSNITLCGAGPNRTFIKADPRRNPPNIVDDSHSRCSESNSNYLKFRTFCIKEGSVIRARPEDEDDDGWFSTSPSSSELLKDYEFPTSTVAVRSPELFSRGSEVLIRAEQTTSWLAEHDMNREGAWDLGHAAYLFRRKVVDIRGNELVLDVPTRYRMRRTDHVKVYKMQSAHEGLKEVGIENLSISIVRHPEQYDLTSCPSDDSADCRDMRESNGKPRYLALYEMYGSELIKLSNLENSWIYNVKTYQPVENSQAELVGNNPNRPYFVEFLNWGLVLKHVRNMTIEKIHLKNMQVDDGAKSGYAIQFMETNDVLLQDGVVENVKKGFAFNRSASGNVIKDMVFSNVFSIENDFHSLLSVANLIDNNVLDGTYWEAAVRPFGSTGHGHGTTQSVFWNTQGIRRPEISLQDWWDRDNNRDGREDNPGIIDDGIIISNQFGWGYIIGTFGPWSKVIAAMMPDRQYNGEKWRPYILPEDYVEGDGYDKDPRYQGKPLEPRSLYDAQLNRHLCGSESCE